MVGTAASILAGLHKRAILTSSATASTIMSDTIVTAPLSQGAGYGVVIGLGALFAIGMIAISNALRRHGVSDDSEEFTGALKHVPQAAHASCETIGEHRLDRCGSHLFLDLEVRVAEV